MLFSADRWRVILKGEQPDYIHAVNINVSFEMISMNCNSITSSLVEGGQEASAQYWPDSGIAHYGEFTVDLLGEEKLQGFVIRNLSVMDTKVC